MLKNLSWVKPDGQIFYATCSLEPEEGEEVIRVWLIWQNLSPYHGELG